MGRFFVDPGDIEGGLVRITGGDADHIRRVLRVKPGELLTVCDGRGTDYIVKVEELKADRVLASVVSSERTATEPPVLVTLFQGIPKWDKMDFIVQKSVELGVSRIVPVITEHTVVRLHDKSDAGKKAARWQKIAYEAAKQCQRGIAPRVEAPVDYAEALDMARDSELALAAHEKAEGMSLKVLRGLKVRSAAVLIGPEGGFSPGEIERALDRGFKCVSLGPRILRTETAGIAVLSVIMYELGDMGR